MPSQAELKTWVPLAEAATEIGCSIRQVARYAASKDPETKIRKAYLKVAGRSDMTVYHPDDVKRLKAFREESRATAEQAREEKAKVPMVTKGASILGQEALATLAEAHLVKQENERALVEGLVPALEAFAAGVHKMLEFQRANPELCAAPETRLLEPAADGRKGRARPEIISPEKKLLLSTAEAQNLGFSADWIKSEIRAGRLRNFGSARRYKVSRPELERAVN